MLPRPEALKVDDELLKHTHQAHSALRGGEFSIVPPDIYRDEVLSDRYNANVIIASELNQHTGAYKVRGAGNFIRQTDPEYELVTASTGNKAAAVAYWAQRTGRTAMTFMPHNTPLFKQERVEAIGRNSLTGRNHADVVIAGKNFDETKIIAQQYCHEQNAYFIHPFDDLQVIAGQGTLALEILNFMRRARLKIDTFIGPVGGGGFTTGNANVFKSYNADTRIIGVEPANAPSMSLAVANGTPTTLTDFDDTVADGANVLKVGIHPLRLVKQLGIEVVRASEAQICQATTDFWERDITDRPQKMEPAAALPFAILEDEAALSNLEAKNIVIPITGGSMDRERYDSHVRLSLLQAV
jgi:threonine dehydratase